MRKLLELIAKHEGFSSKPYEDTVGKLTIGYGRNLDDVGISEAEALDLLSNDTLKATSCALLYPWFEGLNEARQAVIVSMIFNMGPNGFSHFKELHQALGLRDYERAAMEMLDSQWATQVKGRATELAGMMRSGEWS